MEIGQAIREVRKQRGLTQLNLSECAGISQNALSLIEKGHTFPQSATLSKLTQVLEVPVNYLLLLCISDYKLKHPELQPAFDSLYAAMAKLLLDDHSK